MIKSFKKVVKKLSKNRPKNEKKIGKIVKDEKNVKLKMMNARHP
jgi:hypothetical protein